MPISRRLFTFLSLLLFVIIAYANQPVSIGVHSISSGVCSIAVAPDGMIYAGLEGGFFKSSDNGATWTSASKGLGDPKSVLVVCSIALAPDGAIYTGTNDGVFVTKDKAESWKPTGRLLWGEWGYDIGVSSVIVVDGVIYAANDAGIHRSTNKGITWKRVSQRNDIRSLAVGVDGSIFAMLSFSQGILKSMNKGTKWIIGGLELQGKSIRSMAAARDGMLYVGTEGGDGGVFKSTDQGASWKAANRGLPNQGPAYSILAATDGAIYVGQGGAIYKSTDRGASWASASQGLPTQSARIYTDIFSLTETADGTLYVGCRQGIFRSVDKAAHWAPILLLTPRP